MKYLGFAIVAAFIAAIAPAPASAASEDVFVVPRVPVSAQADGASAAKAAAQRRGRRRAMDILLRRLTPENEWIYLPRLARGAPAQAGPAAGRNPVALSDQDLEALESGFEVYGEKSSSRLYRAYITYRFKPKEIRRLLKNAQIPYSEAQTRTALVLPVLQTDKSVYLWEPKNPWMAAWKARPYTHELTPMTAPLGDLEDRRLITAEQALNLAAGPLANVARHYGVSQVVVAHARLRQKDGRDALSVRLINGFQDSGGDAAAAVEAANEGFASGETFGVGAAAGEDFTRKIGDVLAEAYVTEEPQRFATLAEAGIESAIAKYASGWKERTLIDHAAEALLSVSAFFSAVEDWSRIRAALIATPLVGSVQVSSLSKGGAEMDVRVFGAPERLQVAMDNQGVAFWTEGDDRWFLATPSLAAQLKGSRALKPRRRGLFGEEAGEDGRPIPVSQSMDDGVDGKIDQRF